MPYECVFQGHSYVFEVDYGEELETARIIVRSGNGGPEGLFFVQRDGALEAADDLPGFGPNPVADDGLWPLPPDEAIADARQIAEQKGLED